MSEQQWPRQRGSEAEFSDRFGQARTDRFRQAFHEGDPAGDALFDYPATRATHMKQLRTALANGQAAPDDAPAVRAFVADMRESLANVDWKRIARARRVILSIPILDHSIALGPGSLTNTYSSPAIATVLTATGRLVDGALRRLTDTRNWLYHLYFEDALRPGGGGFEHTGMVRAMHAFSRAQHRSRGGGTEDYGEPINSIDMLRTWFDFTHVPHRGLDGMGYTLTDEQLRDVYYFWRTVGGLLGIPADLLEGLDDHESSQPMVDAVVAVSGRPNADSRALVDALVDAVSAQLGLVLGLPAGPLRERTEAQIRMIHGDEIEDWLEVPRRSIQVAEALHVPTVRQRFAFLHQLPDALEQEIATNQAVIVQLLEATEDGGSAYETAPSAAQAEAA